jgi:antitoxin (DNA-binding transcriptional repressor) of toxin-antitoxin stability system
MLDATHYTESRRRTALHVDANLPSVSMTELRTHTEQIILRAACGETIAVTRWGKVVAYIRPADARRSPRRVESIEDLDSLLHDLADSGEITR